jgi:hypothetical protein
MVKASELLAEWGIYPDSVEASAWIGHLRSKTPVCRHLEDLRSRDRAFDLRRLRELINPNTPAGQEVIRLLTEDEDQELRRLLHRHGYNQSV